MFDPSVAALFPLPLTTFEKYMLLDDRLDYPMVFAFRLRLLGEIRRPAFEAAFEEAISSHPLLCSLARCSKRHGEGWVWMLAERLRPTIDWNVLEAAVESPRGERIDLCSEVGLRAWVRQGDGNAEVTLQFHHACCDGIGALRFIGHLLAAYALRTASADHRPTSYRCNPASLLLRGRFADPKPVPGSRTHRVLSSVRDGWRFIYRRPAMLLPHAPNGKSPQDAAAPLPFLRTHHHVFDRSETDRIRQVGVRHRATVNDLLLRDVFHTLRQWNATAASAATRRWLRIAVPVNLRNGDHKDGSAANGVSYTFVTRHKDHCDDSQELLRGICQETDVDTRQRRSLLFLGGFRFMERIRGAVPLYMGADRCFATVVLSNLGRIDQPFSGSFPQESGKVVAGNLILDEIFAAPPVRPNTRAAFLAGRYAERLWICVRCDPRVFSEADATGLLSLYIDRLKQTMAEVT